MAQRLRIGAIVAACAMPPILHLLLFGVAKADGPQDAYVPFAAPALTLVFCAIWRLISVRRAVVDARRLPDA